MVMREDDGFESRNTTAFSYLSLSLFLSQLSAHGPRELEISKWTTRENFSFLMHDYGCTV